MDDARQLFYQINKLDPFSRLKLVHDILFEIPEGNLAEPYEGMLREVFEMLVTINTYIYRVEKNVILVR